MIACAIVPTYLYQRVKVELEHFLAVNEWHVRSRVRREKTKSKEKNESWDKRRNFL